MPTLKLKSYHAKPSDIQRDWYIIDASGQTVGRLASRVAHVLRGKHKPQFTPSVDTGDFVIIINAEKVVLSGNKLEDKIYYRSSQRPGNLKRMAAGSMLEKHPERVLEAAITGMLPHTTLGRSQARKLHIYAGEKHDHAAQTPQPLDFGKFGI